MILVTADQLKSIMPRLADTAALRYANPLNLAMSKWHIDTTLRQAMFLAQLAHESGELRFWVEFGDGKAYEGRADLGNTQPGDGPRYKGRGPIQLTGRLNYRHAGQALGVDLEGCPDLVLNPDVGFQVAGWFWDSRQLNVFADRGDLVSVTRRINGGLNGFAARKAYFETACKVFGVPPPTYAPLPSPH